MYHFDPIWISIFLNDILDTRSRGGEGGRPPRNAQLLTLLLLLWGNGGCMQGAGGGDERLKISRRSHPPSSHLQRVHSPHTVNLPTVSTVSRPKKKFSETWILNLGPGSLECRNRFASRCFKGEQKVNSDGDWDSCHVYFFQPRVAQEGGVELIRLKMSDDSNLRIPLCFH